MLIKTRNISWQARTLLLAMLCHLFAAYFCPLSIAQPMGGGNNLFYSPSLSGAANDPSNNPGNAMNSLTRPSIPLGSAPPGTDHFANWQPAVFPYFPVRYLGLPGLGDSEKEILSQNYFVVINDNKIKSFSQLYKENRLENISSYVTADSVMHSLFAFQNNIKIKVIEHTLVPLLESLILAMIRNNEVDYQNTDDAEIKEEIKYNWAYLTVALKLLEPDFPLPANKGVRKLVTDELENFKQNKPAESVIFHRQEDFSTYNPSTFFKSNAIAKRFYASYQWLGKTYLALSDTTSDATTGNGNEFRRAFLLFQSLLKVQLEPVNSTQKMRSGMQIWKQVNKVLADIGLNSTNSITEQGVYLLPDNFARAVNSTHATINISSLSDPLTRTRLLLTIRGFGPRQLGSMSIFALAQNGSSKDKQLTFHLLSPLYDPLQEISLPEPIFQREDHTTFSLMPIALLLLQNNGVRWASRILERNEAKIDAQILKQLVEQQNALLSADINLESLRPFWRKYANFSNPYPEQLPSYGQTTEWRTFSLERQVAAWTDSLLATHLNSNANTNSEQPKTNNPANNLNEKPTNPAPPSAPDIKQQEISSASTISNTIRKYNLGSWRTNNNFNYLEPTMDLYIKWAQGEQDFENTLNQSGIFPSEYTTQSHDFIRLLKRLAAIAKIELNMDLAKADDQVLLATVDKLLQVIESPLPAKLFIPFPSTDSASNHSKADYQTGMSISGVNMELGYPATLYIIVQYRRCYYLLRGATYSYSEQCGEEINEKHWQRQVEFGFKEAPFWCQSFQRKFQSAN